eukprot:TRINITY_DN59752_c0_g2_i2.p1 TRINITY_DN59752_c0_g2~~TRINITY_DN59752_c0_g2_i2.p1  ORF type:complete len:145 (+),score=27.78 TRINITY_DN59752_c0_g2_i2:53-487(+)
MSGEPIDDQPEIENEEEEIDEGDTTGALKEVLKRARIHNGVAIGLHKAAKALDKKDAQLAVLAEDCTEESYTRLVEALCSEHHIDLVKVKSRKVLGEWCGLGKYDPKGNVKKVVGCSCCAITSFGEQSKALDVLLKNLKDAGGN